MSHSQRSRYYALNPDGTTTPMGPDDVIAWAQSLPNDRWIVAKTRIVDVEVSTVFLGADHNYSRVGPPILFESMIFGGEHDSWQERYATKAAAEAGHAAIVAALREGRDPATVEPAQVVAAILTPDAPELPAEVAE